MERNIKLLALFNFLVEFSFYLPVAIIYFSRVSGSYTLGMSIFAIVMVSSALFELPTGVFSDMIGRRKTITLGAICAAIAVIFYAIGGSYPILVIGALWEGMGRSFFSGNNDAFLHDILASSGKSNEFHNFLGKIGSLEQFGIAIVSIVGSIIASWSFPLVLWLSVIPKLCNVVISLFFTPTSIQTADESNIFAHIRKSLSNFRNNKKLRLISLNTAIRGAVGESSYIFRGAFTATLWPVWAIGITNMISSFGASIGFYFSGKIISKFGFIKSLRFEIITNRFINFTGLLFPTVISPALLSLSSLLYGVGNVADKTLLQTEFSRTERATMGSINNFFISFLFGVSALVLGFIADKSEPRIALIVANVILLFPLLVYKIIFRNHEHSGN